MVDYVFSNNATTQLTEALPAAQVVITLPTGDGAKFPSPGVDQVFMLTVEDRRTNQIEIMQCVGRVADALTVVRAQEGTTAQDFEIGALASNRLTAGTLDWLKGVTGGGGDGGGGTPVDAYTKTESDVRYVNVGGDTMTGLLTLSGPPTLTLHAATKDYVDDAIAAIPDAPPGGIEEAPMDGLQYVRQSGEWVVVTIPVGGGGGGGSSGGVTIINTGSFY